MTPLLAILALPAALDLQVTTGLDNENRAGLAPTGYDSPSITVVDFELTPHLQLALDSRRSQSSIQYRPAMFYRLPDPLERGPIFLHQINAEHGQRISPTARWSNEVFFSIGQTDYSRAAYLLGPEEGMATTVPDVETLSFANLSLASRLAIQFSTRSQLGVAATISGAMPLESEEDPEAEAFPLQVTPALEAEYLYRLSRLSELTAELTTGVYAFAAGSSYVMAAPMLGYGRRLSRNATLSARIGALASLLVNQEGEEDENSQADSGTRLGGLPLAEVDYSHSFRLAYRIVLDVSTGAGFQGQYNMVTTALEPWAGLNLTLGLSLPRRLRLAAAVAAYSPLSQRPTQRMAAATPDPTFASGFVEIIAEPIRPLFLRAGVRTGAHTRHLLDSPGELSQVEMMAYIAAATAFDVWR